VEVPVTPVLTQIPESFVQSIKTTVIPTSTPSPVISLMPTVMGTPAAQNDQIGVSFLYAMVIVVLVVMVEIAAIILYHRNKDKNRQE
jgi:heme/copper-type cytochrome/quinol oxidase subunit 2